jgi:hypothetical protein
MKKKMQRFEDTSLKVWAVISKTSPQIVWNMPRQGSKDSCFFIPLKPDPSPRATWYDAGQATLGKNLNNLCLQSAVRHRKANSTGLYSQKHENSTLNSCFSITIKLFLTRVSLSNYTDFLSIKAVSLATSSWCQVNWKSENFK